MPGNSVIGIISVGLIALFMSSAVAQDAVWEHQQRIQAQQAEESRMMELGQQYYEEDGAGGGAGGGGGAPDMFVSYPPEAWEEWVRHGQEVDQRNREELFAKYPAYRELMQGIWTFHSSGRNCGATFWTLNGGLSFVHLGGTENLTLLGFFGSGIPRVRKPRIIDLTLTQSGEAQRARALNLPFGPMKSMGLVLFNVRTPEILIGAIEDKQDFDIMSDGRSIAHGAWHGGLHARDEMASCLRRQGYLTGK